MWQEQYLKICSFKNSIKNAVLFVLTVCAAAPGLSVNSAIDTHTHSHSHVYSWIYLRRVNILKHLEVTPASLNLIQQHVEYPNCLSFRFLQLPLLPSPVYIYLRDLPCMWPVSAASAAVYPSSPWHGSPSRHSVSRPLCRAVGFVSSPRGCPSRPPVQL